MNTGSVYLEIAGFLDVCIDQIYDNFCLVVPYSLIAHAQFLACDAHYCG